MREKIGNGIILALCIAFLVSCSPHASQVSPPELQQRPQPKINTTLLEKQIHEGINRERKKQGLPQLAWDASLANIARNHSKDMAKRKYFAHESPEGQDFSKRYRQAGYQCAVRTGNRIYMGAENIALNHLFDSVTTINGQAFYDWNSQEKIAVTTVAGWMKSPGHRRNILTPYFQHEGIGVFIDSEGRVYITQNFC